jgi:hypothetical protein
MDGMSDLPTPRRRQRLRSSRRGATRRRWLLRIVVVLILLVVFGPWLASFDPLRKFALGLAAHNVNGRVSAADANFAWWSPLYLQDIQVRAADGHPVITVDYFGTDRTLWQLLTNRNNLGNIRIDSPHLNVLATETTNNLAETFPKHEDQLKGQQGPPSEAWKQLSMHVVVTNASVTWKLSDQGRVWSIDRIPFSFALVPANLVAKKPAEIVIDPTLIFDQREITPELCNDVLKYVAPVLANVATAQGKVSLAIDGGHLPLEDPKSGELSGRLTLHSVDVGGGAIAAKIAEVFSLPTKLSLARENVVEFKMAGGRVYHEGLEFGIEGVNIRTRGSVGFDQTLDIIAELHFDLSDSLTANRPILSALKGQVLRVPVRGTLNKPEVDKAVLTQSGLSLVDHVLKLARERRTGVPAPTDVPPTDTPTPEGLTPEALDRLRELGVLVPEELPTPTPDGGVPVAAVPPGGAVPPGAVAPPGAAAPPPTTGDQIRDLAIDIGQELLQRRRDRIAREKQAPPQAPPPAPAGVTPNPPPAPPSPPPRRGLIGRAIDRFRAPPEPPPPTPAPPE